MNRENRAYSFSSSGSSTWVSSFLEQVDPPIIHISARGDSINTDDSVTTNCVGSSASKPLMRRGLTDSSGVVVFGESALGVVSTGLSGSHFASRPSTGSASRSSSSSTSSSEWNETYNSASPLPPLSVSSSTDTLIQQSIGKPGKVIFTPRLDTTDTQLDDIPVMATALKAAPFAARKGTMTVGESLKQGESSDSSGFASFVALIKSGDLATAFDSWHNTAKNSNNTKAPPASNVDTGDDPARSFFSTSFRDVWHFRYSPSQTQSQKKHSLVLPYTVTPNDSPLGFPTPTKRSSRSIWKSMSTTGLLATIQEEMMEDEFTATPTTIRPNDRRYFTYIPEKKHQQIQAPHRSRTLYYVTIFAVFFVIAVSTAIIVLLIGPIRPTATRQKTFPALTIQPTSTPSKAPTRPTPAIPVAIVKETFTPSGIQTSVMPTFLPLSITTQPVRSTVIPITVTRTPVRAGPSFEPIPNPSTVLGPGQSPTTSSPSMVAPITPDNTPTSIQPLLFQQPMMPSPVPSQTSSNKFSSNTLFPSAGGNEETTIPFTATTDGKSNEWNQVGQDIIGANPNERLGFAVAVAKHANIIAVGSPRGGEQGLGVVKVFSIRSHSDNADLVQIGESLTGGNDAGHAVDLSDDGTLVAFGSPKNSNSIGRVDVFQIQSGNWVQLGNRIFGQRENERFGESISLVTHEGLILLAIGAPFREPSGSTEVYIYDSLSDQWIRYGQDIQGNGVGDLTIALSGDGSTLGIGSENEKDDKRMGVVRFYTFDALVNQWAQLGQDVHSANFDVVTSLALSSNGYRAVIGRLNFGTVSGRVDLLKLDIAESMALWTLTTTLSSTREEGNGFGADVSITDDGSIIAVGGPGGNPGFVQVWHAMNFQNWEVIFETSGRGDLQVDSFGYSVSISGNGSTLVIGQPFHSFEETTSPENAGHLRVFATLNTTQDTVDSQVAQSPSSHPSLSFRNETPIPSSQATDTELLPLEPTTPTLQAPQKAISTQLPSLVSLISSSPPLSLETRNSSTLGFDVVQTPTLQPDHNLSDPSKGPAYNLMSPTKSPFEALKQPLSRSPFGKQGESSNSSLSFSLSFVPSTVPSFVDSTTSPVSVDTESFVPLVDVGVHYRWQLMGNEISGPDMGNFTSVSNKVCLSSEGNIAAVASESGVRVLELKAGFWIQIGQMIPGLVIAMELSGDGQVLAFGYLLPDSSSRVETFRFDGKEQWVQVGKVLSGSAAFTSSISLSNNGFVVAIGTPLENNTAGYICVHRYDDFVDDWFQIGESIAGDSVNDYTGTVRLNSDGTRLVVGYPGHSSSKGQNVGLVRVFDIKQGSWQQVGQDLCGQAMLKQLGHAVAISSTGNYIAVSAPFICPSGALEGQVFVYSLSNIGEWENVGSTIQEGIYSDDAGRSLSISSDGMTVCLGAPRAQSVRIMQFSSQHGIWERVGYFQDNSHPEFGASVSLSGDGLTLAISSGREIVSESSVVVFHREDNR